MKLRYLSFITLLAMAIAFISGCDNTPSQQSAPDHKAIAVEKVKKDYENQGYKLKNISTEEGPGYVEVTFDAENERGEVIKGLKFKDQY